MGNNRDCFVDNSVVLKLGNYERRKNKTTGADFC